MVFFTFESAICENPTSKAKIRIYFVQSTYSKSLYIHSLFHSSVLSELMLKRYIKSNSAHTSYFNFLFTSSEILKKNI